jgi:hypothetical protein
MATFYLLPPRPAFQDSLAQFVQSWLPGLTLPKTAAMELAEALGSHLSQQQDMFLIFREDLPDGARTDEALRDFFGANAGDNVIELRLGARPGDMIQRSWTLADVSAA